MGRVGFPLLPPPIPATGLVRWGLSAKPIPRQERSHHASEVGPHNTAELTWWLSLQQMCRFGTGLVTHVDYGQTRSEGRINAAPECASSWATRGVKTAKGVLLPRRASSGESRPAWEVLLSADQKGTCSTRGTNQVHPTVEGGDSHSRCFACGTAPHKTAWLL